MGDIKYTSLGDWAKDTCDAIRSKDGTSKPIAHGDIPERIKAIPTGSDTSGITATAADVSENVKFLSKDGVLTQGTMPEIAGEEITLTSTNSETTIAEGHHDGTGKVKADYSGLADVSGLDAEAANVRSGKTFIGSSGTKETGSMTEYSDTTAKSIYSNGTWSLTDGYYNNAKVYVSVSSSSGALGVPDISVNSSTGVITATSKVSSSGYISSSSTKDGTLQMTTQSAKTWTPTTSNQTISSGTYLTGAQTIKGDSNLVASNIKSGVSIFGVTGTYSGSAPQYTIDSYSDSLYGFVVSNGYYVCDIYGAFNQTTLARAKINCNFSESRTVNITCVVDGSLIHVGIGKVGVNDLEFRAEEAGNSAYVVSFYGDVYKTVDSGTTTISISVPAGENFFVIEAGMYNTNASVAEGDVTFKFKISVV